jgi:F0F1-type ATP synthase epsilon subunit
MTNASPLVLKVLSPEGIILEENNLTAVNIPLVDGARIGVRPGHAPLIAETDAGTIKYRSENLEKQIRLHAGVLDIRNNIIIVLTAGEIVSTQETMSVSAPSEYDRLMQTLIRQIQPDLGDETRQENQ